MHTLYIYFHEQQSFLCGELHTALSQHNGRAVKDSQSQWPFDRLILPNLQCKDPVNGMLELEGGKAEAKILIVQYTLMK